MTDGRRIDLVALLDLEPIEVNLFRGSNPRSTWPQVFGGQVVAQAMVAACRTVEGRLPHSLHAYFILPGDTEAPIVYEVGRLRDGRTFSTRRVTAIQHGQPIFFMIVSFSKGEDGTIDFQETTPRVPPPEQFSPKKLRANPLIAAAPDAMRVLFEKDESQRRRPVDIRPVEVERFFGSKIADGRTHAWVRVKAPLPDDPAIHQAALAYISDFTLLDGALAREGTSFLSRDLVAASLDHAMWFHRPFRADDWLLYAHDSPNANGGRALARGLFFKPDGTLVATVAQEGVIRRRRPKAAPDRTAQDREPRKPGAGRR